jgi:arylsulfatase A-like enzyme
MFRYIRPLSGRWTDVGRLFKAMREAGQMDNTVIIFMGDNGTPGTVKDKAARIPRLKGTVYEAVFVCPRDYRSRRHAE